MNPDSFIVPDVVVSHFHLKEGDSIADFGAGTGYFLKALSSRVGTGTVYACEIQKSFVEKIGEFVRTQGLHNVHPLWCDLEEVGGVPVKDATLDVGLLINTLFQLEDKPSAVTELARVIRTGGRLMVIDWSESFGGLGPAPDHVVSEKEATDFFEQHGFVLEHSFPAGAHHYGLAFRKV